ncbi:MAG: DUF1835 domain-containing protein [Pyrinomonadaceae bacterium]
MLHIHNGDCSAQIARQTKLPGEHLAWREALIEGPTPADVTGDEWRKLRSRHLSEFYEVDAGEAERELWTQEEKVASYSQHDEVVLWFERDLFCQTNLLYLIDWFSRRELGKTKLSLIFIGEFPGLPNFRGLGELNLDQLASLFDFRHEVSAAEIRLATSAWRAYCSADPTALEALLSTDTSAMPFLSSALQLHLERFPFVRNGLGRVQNRGLEFIYAGTQRFVDLFPKFAGAESAYGLGDAQFWRALRQMSEAHEPLIKIRNGGASDLKLTPDKIQNIAFEITKAGAAVLNAQADFVEMNGIDVWLGGVHLIGNKNLWRWDDQNKRLTYA